MAQHTLEDIEAALQQLRVEVEAEVMAQQATLQELLNRVGSVAGKKYTTELTAQQRLDVLGLVLYKLGVLDRAGRVRNLMRWVSE